MSEYPKIFKSEFEHRMGRLKEKMREQKIDLLVAYSNALDPGHVRYFTDVVGINESTALLVLLNGAPIVCVGQACQDWAKHKSQVSDVRILPEVGEVAGTEYLIGEKLTFSGLFTELKNNFVIRKIGIAGTLIFPQFIYEQLRSTFPQVEIINAESLIFALRSRKSQSEIDCIQKAGRILDATFADTF